MIHQTVTEFICSMKKWTHSSLVCLESLTSSIVSCVIFSPHHTPQSILLSRCARTNMPFAALLLPSAKSPKSLRYISGTQNLLGSDGLYRTHGDCLQITSEIWIWIVNTTMLIFIATCSWKIHKSRETEQNMNIRNQIPQYT